MPLSMAIGLRHTPWWVSLCVLILWGGHPRDPVNPQGSMVPLATGEALRPFAHLGFGQAKVET